MRGRINKSIAIIGEGETEWFYFESLRIAKRYPFRLVPGMAIEKISSSQTQHLPKRKYNSCNELLPELQKYMPGYEKTKRYFRTTDLYSFLETNGDIGLAVQNGKILSELSKSDPDDEICYSEIYKVINIIQLMHTPE